MDIQIMDIIIDSNDLQSIIGRARLEVHKTQNASILAFHRLEHIVFFQHGFRQLAVHQLLGEKSSSVFSAAWAFRRPPS